MAALELVKYVLFAKIDIRIVKMKTGMTNRFQWLWLRCLRYLCSMEDGEYDSYLSKPLWLTHCESPVVSVKLPLHGNLSDTFLTLHSCEARRLAMFILMLYASTKITRIFDNFLNKEEICLTTSLLVYSSGQHSCACLLIERQRKKET